MSLLVLLYVLQANGCVIPVGCFVAAWIATGFGSIIAIIKAILK